MKNANIVLTLIGTLTSLVAVTCLAQSFMNYGGTPDTSSSGAPRLAPGGKIAPLSPDDFKSRVTTLGRKNQEKLAQQVQSMIPPSGSPSSSSASTSTVSTTSTPTSSSPSTSTTPPAAVPAPPARSNYPGFGTGNAPASSGSSGGASGSSGFGIKY